MAGFIDKAIKRLTLGDAKFRDACTVGMPDPQMETRIFLEGLGDPLDVTNNHVIACASPFTVAIGLNPEPGHQVERNLRLRFQERGGTQDLIGDVGVLRVGTLATAEQSVALFRIRTCSNYCRGRVRLHAYELYNALERWRTDNNPEIRMSILGVRAMSVFFSCPRPVVLVSAEHNGICNMFPVNLIGSIGQGYFAFALNSLRTAAPLLKRAGRLALSSIPVEQAETVRKLGKNHRLESVDWNLLPFATGRSSLLGFPVPCFALRVREMEIEAVRELGSHTLFVSRLISDKRLADGLQFCIIHGLYHGWRLESVRARAKTSCQTGTGLGQGTS